MAAGSVGSLTVQIMKGRVARLKERVDKWEVMGVTGVGSQTMAGGDGESEITTITFCDDDDAAEEHIADAEALQGQIVTITDNFGEQFDLQLIEHVDTTDCKKKVIRSTGDQFRVQLRWKLVAS